MKTPIKLFTLLALTLSISFYGCDKDDDVATAEDAKVELEAATQEIFYNVALMMSTPQVESMMFLSQLMGLQIELKSAAMHVIYDVEKYNMITASQLLKKKFYSRSTLIDPLVGGEYTYNFSTGEFDLTNSEIDYLSLIYPANQQAYGAQQNNANIVVTNLEYVEVEYNEEWGVETEFVPTNADIEMSIDDQTVMTLNYSASINDEGMPTATNIHMNMNPYSMTLGLSGSGSSYNSTMSFRMNNETLLSYNLNFSYTSSMDYINTVSGSIEASPLRFEGNVNAEALDNCGENDINCMNNNIDVEVFQSAKDLYLGQLEFRMYYDDFWEEEYPELAIVYEDGTFDFLFDFLGMDGFGKKRGTPFFN